jgi:hypothetical protein
MLPSICQTSQFVCATAREARTFAENPVLVGQLSDCVAIWLGQVETGVAEWASCLQLIDSVSEINVSKFSDALQTAEKSLKFHEHFDRDQVSAVLRVLRVSPSASLVSRVEAAVSSLRELHNDALSELHLFRDLADLFRPQAWDQPFDVYEAIFSGFRALWFCSSAFGRHHRARYHRLLHAALMHCQHSVARAGSQLQRASSTQELRSARRALVDAQQRIVCFQSSYCTLLEAIIEYDSLDWSARLDLSYLDWQFARVLLAIEIVEFALSDWDRFLLQRDLFTMNICSDEEPPSETIIQRIARFQRARLLSPQEIDERIRSKAQRLESTRSGRETHAKPFEGMALIFSFDPPEIGVTGDNFSVAQLQDIEDRFASCFSLPAVGKGRPNALDHFEPSSHSQRLVLSGAASSNEQRMHSMVSVLDWVSGWEVTDTHAYVEGHVERHVFLFHRL